jgi:hypothetical protein
LRAATRSLGLLPSGFSPPSIPGLTAWYDATKITGLSDGSALGTWDDLSGNGQNLTQSSGGSKPTYYSSTAAKLVNALPAVWFTSPNSYMTTSAFGSTLADTTIFIVAGTSSDTSSYYDGLTSSHRQMLFWGSSALMNLYAGSGAPSTAIWDDYVHCWTAQFNGSSSLLREDGTSELSGANPGSNALDGLTLGTNYAETSSVFLNGPVCEFIVYTGALTLANIELVEGYLLAKWMSGTGDDPETLDGLLALAPPGRDYSVNPILSPVGPSDPTAWDGGQVMECSFILNPTNPNQWLIYYCGEEHVAAGGGIALCTAATNRPLDWTQYASNPIISAGSIPGVNETSIRLDSVVYDPVNETINVYSSGYGSTYGAAVSLWTAPADDPTNFTSYSSTPVWTPAQTGISGVTETSQFAVLRVSADEWYAYYAWRTSSATLPGVRLATSSDGKSWTDASTQIIGLGSTYDATYIEWHQILPLPDGNYLLVYECYGTDDLWTVACAYNSVPNTAFTKYSGNPIFIGSNVVGSFDQVDVATPAIWQLNGKWYLTYCGTDPPDEGYGYGYWAVGMARF